MNSSGLTVLTVLTVLPALITLRGRPLGHTPMTAADLIGQVLAAGGRIAADGPDLVLTAPRPLPADLLNMLKAHKPAILAELAHSLMQGRIPRVRGPPVR